MGGEILIVGAGPTGLVLALWLTRLGIPVRIISKAAGPGTASRALAVHARTLEFYDQIDLADTVVAEGYEVGGANLWVGGVPQAHISLQGAGRAYTKYPFLHIFPQDRHEALLVDHLAAMRVAVDWDTELLDFSEEGSGIRARLKHADGGEEIAEVAYLAGCDGASSTVRHRLGIGFPGDTYEQTFYVADVEAEGPPMNGALNIDIDRSDFLAIFPLDAGERARLVGTVREDAAAAGSLAFEDINRKAVESLKINVTKVNWFSSYRVHHRVVDQFRRGRAFLLGDAAHVHSPAGGQGMNTGIGDAVNLAWKLAMVLKGAAPDQLLDSYEEERIAFARKLVSTTDRVFSLATSESRLARWVRTNIVPAVVPLAVELEPLREWMFRTVSQLEISYRGDRLSEGEAGDVHGGDRLPWLALEDGRSNHDALRDIRWQVHVHGYAGHEVEAWCRDNGLPLHVLSWTPEFQDAGFARDAAYLVRPDGYVAAALRVASVEGLQAYFAGTGISLPLQAR